MKSSSAILLGLLTLGSLGEQASAQRAEDLLGVLSSHRRADHSQAEVAQALAALEPNPVPLLFDMHRRGPEAFFQGEEIDISRYWCTPDLFSALALEALERCPLELVVSHGSQRLGAAADLGERLALLRVLGRLESSACLPLLDDLLAGMSDAELGSLAVRRAWQDAVGRVLATDQESPEALFQAARRLPPERLELYVHAALAAEHPRALELLVSLLGLDAGVDVIILRHMTWLQARFPWHVDERVGQSILEALGGSSPAAQREAARAAGELRLVEAASALIQRLKSPDPAMVRVALDSLRHLSGNRFQRADADWAGWLSAELEWWQAEAEPLFDAVLARDLGDPGDHETQASGRFDALRKLARHPLHSHAIAARVGQALPAMEPELAERAMQLLVVLDSGVACPVLVEELGAPEAPRRASAYLALVRLSGQELAPEREAWEAFLRP